MPGNLVQRVRPRPYVRVGLSLPGLTTDVVYLDFLVDSGAVVSMVAGLTALTPIGVPLARLAQIRTIPTDEEIIGLGGAVKTRPTPAVYLFEHEDGRGSQIAGQISIGEFPTAVRPFPSVLGWDVLDRFRITLDSLSGDVLLEER